MVTEPSRRTHTATAGRIVLALLVRSTVLGLVWVALAGADLAYAGYGVVSVAAAVILSLAMLPVENGRRQGARRTRRRLRAVATLPLWFAGKSIVGGADVAWRAVRRPVDIEPAVVRAPCLLEPGHPRDLALLMMNLMPGSMVQRVVDDGETVELHTLSEDLRPARQWGELQRRVADAFGTPVR